MHDCSEGGLGVSASEMAFSGGLGMELFLSEVPYSAFKIGGKNKAERNDSILFSESNSRFIVEIEKKHQEKFEKLLKGISYGLIGCVSPGKDFKIFGLDGKICVDSNIDELKESWQKPLRW
jgi:phosphoribosylformylglycinamidine synthase